MAGLDLCLFYLILEMVFLKKCNLEQMKLSGSGKHFTGLSSNIRTETRLPVKV